VNLGAASIGNDAPGEANVVIEAPLGGASVERFLAHCTDLEPKKWVKIVHWGDAEEARRIVVAGIERCKAVEAKA
jgi:hypothetical protein